MTFLFFSLRGRGRYSCCVVLAAAGLIGPSSACSRKGDTPPFGPDNDGDGWPRDLDCDDEDTTIFPGANEVFDDDVDQDCSGSAAMGMGGALDMRPATGGARNDGTGGRSATGGSGMGGEGQPLEDADGDGFAPFPLGEDCDDTRGEVFPGAIEVVLNGIDENCDGSDLAGTLESQEILRKSAVVGEPPDVVVVEIDGEKHLMLAWADSRVEVRQDVYGQILDLEGRPVGQEFPIDTADNHAKTGLRLVSKGDAVLAVWATAEGVFAQQLEANGELRGIRFGLADAGASHPVPAFGADETEQGGSWAVAWLRPSDSLLGQAQMRAMSTDVEAIRAPIETLAGPDEAAISDVALVGSPQGFLAAWVQSEGEDSKLMAQMLSRTGAPTHDEFLVHEGFVVDPMLARREGNYAVVFRTGGALGHAAALLFEPGDDDETVRELSLSGESVAQSDFRAVATPHGLLTLWNDGRHLDHSVGVQAIYGSMLIEGESVRPFGRAVYADTNVVLGGVASHQSDWFVVLKSGSRAKLLRMQQF